MAKNLTDPLKYSDLEHHAIPLDRIRTEEFLPALKSSIEQAKQRIEIIKANPAQPDFDNTIVALETAGEEVELVNAVFSNQLSAHTSDELQAVAKEFGPLLAAYSNDILLDEALFRRIQQVYSNYFDDKGQRRNATEGRDLTTEEARLLDKYYSDFKRNGALLTPEQKEELRRIDARLAQLGPQFAENVLKATNDFQLVLTRREEVAGLPDIILETARQAAQAKGLKTEGDGPWLFTLHAPSLIPFLTYAENREAREKMWRANASRAFRDKYDNQDLILETLKLRHQRARLLGYDTHADFVLEKRMAESAERVMNFLNRLKGPSLQRVRSSPRTWG